jgi:hypothetical protein
MNLKRSFTWREIAVFGFMGLLAAALVVGAILALRAFSCAEKVARQPVEALDKAEEVARAFKTGTIKTQFISYATRVQGTARLQVVEVGQMEVFRKKDSTALFWNLLPLPDVEVEISLPVMYTYYVDLDQEWRFELEGRTVKVHVPELKHNKPAPDISKMEIKEKRSLVRFVEDDLKRQILESMTAELDKRAEKNVADLNLRATAGENIAKFVQAWFATVLKAHGVEEAGEIESYRVEVYFPGSTILSGAR